MIERTRSRRSRVRRGLRAGDNGGADGFLYFGMRGAAAEPQGRGKRENKAKAQTTEAGHWTGGEEGTHCYNPQKEFSGRVYLNCPVQYHY